MDEKRYCVIWNDPATPISQIIRTSEPENITKLVLDFLIYSWGWTAEELSERNKNVHVVEITDESQTDPRVVGTMALFRDDGEGSVRIFTDLIPVYKGETAKQALMERATPKLSEFITFKVPDELLTRTYGGEGTPLLTKIGSDTDVVITIIGFVLFIDSSLSKALEIFDLQRFWLEEPSEGFIWTTPVVVDFSCHIRALCEDHSIDAPCPLE